MTSENRGLSRMRAVKIQKKGLFRGVSCFVLFVFLLLCHCDQLVKEEGASCIAFLWFMTCVPFVMGCLLVLLVSLVGYVL